MSKFLNQNNIEKIKNILIKKSEGYYYSEEILEYQSNIQPSEIKQSKQISIFSDEQEKNEHTNEKHKDLTLLKKKVTTHYIPPDLLAVKMLIEIFGKEVNNDDSHLENLTDSELEDLKNQIIDKLNQIEGG